MKPLTHFGSTFGTVLGGVRAAFLVPGLSGRGGLVPGVSASGGPGGVRGIYERWPGTKPLPALGEVAWYQNFVGRGGLAAGLSARWPGRKLFCRRGGLVPGFVERWPGTQSSPEIHLLSGWDGQSLRHHCCFQLCRQTSKITSASFTLCVWSATSRLLLSRRTGRTFTQMICFGGRSQTFDTKNPINLSGGPERVSGQMPFVRCQQESHS